MAAVTQRRPGVWKVQVRTGGSKEAGWRYKTWTVDADTRTPDFPSGVRSKKDAQRFGEIEEHKIAGMTARFVAPSNEKLGDYLTRWLEGRRAGKRPLRPTSHASYDQMIRCHIIPALGNVALDALSPVMVNAWLDDMAAGRGAEVKIDKDGKVTPKPVSPRTASYARTVLRIALQDAVKLGQVAQNVVDRTDAPKQEPREVGAFTLAQGQALFAEADRTRYGQLLRFVMFSGLRRGEALGLKWSDTNTETGAVTVRRTRVALSGGALVQEKAKTNSGLREVRLPAPALDALKAQRKAQVDDKRRALKTGTPYQDEDWVFATAEGHGLNPKNVSRDFRRIRDLAGAPAGLPAREARKYLKDHPEAALPELPLHATRHTAVTLMLAAGIDLPTISKLIGHKRYAFTVDRYGHLSEEAAQGAADRMTAFLAGRVKPAAKPAQ